MFVRTLFSAFRGSEGAYHSTSSTTSTDSILGEGINPDYFNPESRFGGGLYMATDVETAAAELSHHGRTVANTISFDVKTESFLNATSPAMNLGVKYAPNALSGAARGLGYDGIIYNSLRGTGTNVVQFSNFKLLTNGTVVQ